VKQRAYRNRLKEREPKDDKRYHWRLQKLHAIIERAAAAGNEQAEKMLGINAYDTALRMIVFSQPPSGAAEDSFAGWDLEGFELAFHSYEQAVAQVALDQAGKKYGVFQIG
jgi:hypothetical protein